MRPGSGWLQNQQPSPAVGGEGKLRRAALPTHTAIRRGSLSWTRGTASRPAAHAGAWHCAEGRLVMMGRRPLAPHLAEGKLWRGPWGPPGLHGLRALPAGPGPGPWPRDRDRDANQFSQKRQRSASTVEVPAAADPRRHRGLLVANPPNPRDPIGRLGHSSGKIRPASYFR